MGKVTATRFAEAGLSVVTAEANIRATAANGADVIAVPTNVSDTYVVANLAEAALKTGEAARLMNKARPLDSLAGPGCGPAEPCALVPRTVTTPRCGGVPEWSIGAVSKTVVPLAGTVGSNPTPSATQSSNLSQNRETFCNRPKVGRYLRPFPIGELLQEGVPETTGAVSEASLLRSASRLSLAGKQEQGIFAF